MLFRSFAFSELLARVQALIRRATSAPEATRLTAGDVTLDLVSREVTCGGRPVELQPREFSLLAFLLRPVLAAVPASGEIIEGATLLVAVVVLFSVSYWLLSKVESARWQQFIREQVSAALSKGGSAALGFVAFLAVFLGVPWGFLLFPVLVGSLLLVLLAWAFSRWVPGAMPYPLHWL